MLGVIIALLLGIIIGVITGLLPGLHPNTVAIASVGLATTFDPMLVATFLVSAGVTNSFVTFIPSILLGAPEDDSALSVLPGHRLLKQGRGFEAIRLSVVGGIGATAFTLMTLPVFIIVIPNVYNLIRPQTHWLLIFVAAYMIFREKKILIALTIFLFAGILGLTALNHMGSEALFPLLTGLFGLPLLRISYKQKTKLPKNISFKTEKLKKMFLLSSISIGSLAGIIAGLLPGIGSAQAAVLAQEATGMENNKNSTRSFLISLGGINTADIIYSLFAILLIGNPRSGIAVAVSQILTLKITDMLILIPVIFISASIAALLTLRISKYVIFSMGKIDYSLLTRIVFYLLWMMILLFSGISGLIIAFFAMIIGYLPNKFSVRRTHCMGCLMLPTILYFLNVI